MSVEDCSDCVTKMINFLIIMMAFSDVVYSCDCGYRNHNEVSLHDDDMVFHRHNDALALCDVPILYDIRAYDMMVPCDVLVLCGIPACECDIHGILVSCDDLHSVVVVYSVHNDVGLACALHDAMDNAVKTMVCRIDLELALLTQLPKRSRK